MPNSKAIIIAVILVLINMLTASLAEETLLFLSRGSSKMSVHPDNTVNYLVEYDFVNDRIEELCLVPRDAYMIGLYKDKPLFTWNSSNFNINYENADRFELEYYDGKGLNPCFIFMPEDTISQIVSLYMKDGLSSLSTLCIDADNNSMLHYKLKHYFIDEYGFEKDEVVVNEFPLNVDFGLSRIAVSPIGMFAWQENEEDEIVLTDGKTRHLIESEFRSPQAPFCWYKNDKLLYWKVNITTAVNESTYRLYIYDYFREKDEAYHDGYGEYVDLEKGWIPCYNMSPSSSNNELVLFAIHGDGIDSFFPRLCIFIIDLENGERRMIDPWPSFDFETGFKRYEGDTILYSFDSPYYSEPMALPQVFLIDHTIS